MNGFVIPLIIFFQRLLKLPMIFVLANQAGWKSELFWRKAALLYLVRLAVSVALRFGLHPGTG
jgi:hypothetical protein